MRASLCNQRFYQGNHNWITGGYTGECSDSWPRRASCSHECRANECSGHLDGHQSRFQEGAAEIPWHLMRDVTTKDLRSLPGGLSMRTKGQREPCSLITQREVNVTGIEHRVYLYCTKLRQSKPAGKNSPSCCEPLVEASSANIKINIHVSICLPRCGDGGSLAARGSFRLSLFSSGHPADPSNT